MGRDDGSDGKAAPVIGVLCCNRMLDGRPVQAVASRFVEPLATLSGASVLLVPALPGAVDARRFAGMLDGLLLTGSCSNLAASRYGGQASGARTDEDRDETALRLAGAMIEAGRPVFGICRGLQELNVLFGGSLADQAGHHHDGAEDDLDTLFGHGHALDVAAGGLLEGVFGGRRSHVNSIHHQGIDRLGTGLTIEARAPDGLIEAISARPCGAPVLGVQWHPEWGAAANAESRAFFGLLGRAARGEMAH